MSPRLRHQALILMVLSFFCNHFGMQNRQCRYIEIVPQDATDQDCHILTLEVHRFSPTIPQPIKSQRLPLQLEARLGKIEGLRLRGCARAASNLFVGVPLQVSDIIIHNWHNPGVHLIICSEAQIWDKWMYSEFSLLFTCWRHSIVLKLWLRFPMSLELTIVKRFWKTLKQIPISIGSLVWEVGVQLSKALEAQVQRNHRKPRRLKLLGAQPARKDLKRSNQRDSCFLAIVEFVVQCFKGTETDMNIEDEQVQGVSN